MRRDLWWSTSKVLALLLSTYALQCFLACHLQVVRFQEVEEGKYGIDQRNFWFGHREVVEGTAASAEWRIEDVVNTFPVTCRQNPSIS